MSQPGSTSIPECPSTWLQWCASYPLYCVWTSWSACSAPCGNSGTQTRTAVVFGTATACYQTRPCNRFCHNGGTPLATSCSCPLEFQPNDLKFGMKVEWANEQPDTSRVSTDAAMRECTAGLEKLVRIPYYTYLKRSYRRGLSGMHGTVCNTAPLLQDIKRC
ncbi:hypothetical protein Bbelb_341260 [Branchiostoma belcheri]|nr:hypothetical protein Bbelb_341260 [Branchiostoma belcheri]